MVTSTSLYKVPVSTDYNVGVYADENDWISINNRMTSMSIKTRPAYDYTGDRSAKVLLGVYSKDQTVPTAGTDIDTAKKTALGYLEFTVVIEPEDPAYTMAFKVQDSKTKEEITDATITFKKEYSTVYPTDNLYKMENGSSYTVTVKKTGYNDYKEEFTFTGDPKNINSTKVINMKPVVERTVSFKIVDENTGEEIPGAAEKLQVKEGYSTTLKAENDGTYKLTEDKKYNYSVSGIKNYKNVSSTDFTVTENDSDTITIPMEVDISEYKVTIQPKDGNTEINSAAIEVNSVELDWDDEEIKEKVDAQADGTYLLRKGTKYEYEIKADEYKAAKGSFTPSGNDENITLPVQMVKDSEVSEADQKTVDDLKTAFNSVFNMGKVRPKYAAEKNVVEFVKNKLAGKADISGVNIALVSSDDLSVIGMDGTIHYRAKKMTTGFGVNSFNVGTVFRFELNGAVATVEATTQVGWDCKYFNSQMQAESEKLSWNMIKGSNEDAAAVTTDLSLPQCMSTSAKTAWSEITWESSDPEVITFEDTGYGMISPKKGVIHPRPADTEVTLTATFKANDTLLNGNVESVDDFATYTREFKITVEGTHIAPPTEEELKAILDKYYTADSIKDFVTDKNVDLSNCQSDLKLPRYTRIKDDDGNLVFNNKEITVTSENEAISIKPYSYRTYTDVFYDKDITGDLVVTFSRQGVTVEKRIPVTVKPLSEEALDAEVAMMEQAKLHYFDGINDSANVDKDTVKENLHAFKEMTLDAAGEPVWAYNVNDVKGTGIIADDLFDDSWIMEGAGFNKFKSSNQAVITHDNLLVHRRETDEEITISSVLCS